MNSAEMLFDANASARSAGVGTARVTREVLENALTYTPPADPSLSLMDKRVRAAASDVEQALYDDGRYDAVMSGYRYPTE